MRRLSKQNQPGLLVELTRALAELEGRAGVSAEERGRWARLRQGLDRQLTQNPEQPLVPDAIDPTDLSDLPPDLLSELSVARADPLEAQIISVLQACGGSADLDRILIGLYRKFQTVQKRRPLQNKLWRMVRKGDLRKAKAERGIFSLPSTNGRGRKDRRRE
ncbi:MAG TPA: hypothetical protein VGM17_18800 [Rhizomicrobium sp.]